MATREVDLRAAIRFAELYAKQRLKDRPRTIATVKGVIDELRADTSPDSLLTQTALAICFAGWLNATGEDGRLLPGHPTDDDYAEAMVVVDASDNDELLAIMGSGVALVAASAWGDGALLEAAARSAVAVLDLRSRLKSVKGSINEREKATTPKQIVATLWDQIHKLRRGETTPAQADAVTRDAGKQVARARAELKAARAIKHARRR